MSSNFTGVTFAEQRVTPADDAQIRRAILPDGIISGCGLSYSGSTLTMASGSLIACGRQFRHPAAQNWAVVDATSGYARLVLTIDLTKAATEDSFEQVVDTIEYASSVDGFSTLVQSDINRSGTKYQIEACVVSLGAGGITGFVSRMDYARPVDESAFMKAIGDQTLSGNLEILGYLYTKGFLGITSSDGFPRVGFTDVLKNTVARVQVNDATHQLCLHEYCPDNSGCRESFFLPAPDNHPTSKEYRVLTSKTHGMVKLWENADTTNSFPAQTISLDLSAYAGVAILYRQESTSDDPRFLNTGFVPKDKTSAMWYTSPTGSRMHREFVAKDTGISFENGEFSGNSTTSLWCVPAVIYGIKGVS